MEKKQKIEKIEVKEFEKEVLKEVLTSSKKMYEQKIRSAENTISWYNRQLDNIESQLSKLR